MTQIDIIAARAPRIGAVPRFRLPPAVALAGLTAAFTLVVVASAAASLEAAAPARIATILLLALSVAWIAGGAATALIGCLCHTPASPAPPPRWRPATRTAILVTLCREDPAPVTAALATLHAGLARAGLGSATEIFVLSDTSGAAETADESRALATLIEAGRIRYRRRARNSGRKPGNIADWMDRHGGAFDFMLVLDADSRMTAARIARMILRMEREPATGLLQAGIALSPARTRFGRLQRVSARLLGPCFARGFAAWAGGSGNYWGHNALIRTAAFREAVALPVLSGRPPFGGAVLSHDFVEAAWIRRAGWRVALDPALAGSAEAAPVTLEEFHRRDRRWCQGNLQHLRLIGAPKLHPASRLHMASGVFSYLAAPVWLTLLLLMGSGAVAITSVVPILLIAALLLTPKLCGLARYFGRRSTPRRRAVALRAAGHEFALSVLLAPLLLVRQAGAVAAVLAGRDCGWKRRETRARRGLPHGVPEAGVGLALGLAVLALNPSGALWLLPVLGPLLAAPALVRMLDRPA